MFPMPKTTPTPVDIDRLKERLTKAHVKLITHPETMLYGSVILMKWADECLPDPHMPAPTG